MEYLQASLLGVSHDKTWWRQKIRKRSVLEFAKTESIVMVQWRFWTKYHTEPPTGKKFVEWYKKFQQSYCLCAAKWTGQLGPLADIVKRVRNFFKEPSEVNILCKPGIADASVKCLVLLLHHTSILTSMLPSVLIFPVVRLGVLLIVTLLSFPGLHSHLT
jgi:hypothetical protein